MRAKWVWKGKKQCTAPHALRLFGFLFWRRVLVFSPRRNNLGLKFHLSRNAKAPSTLRRRNLKTTFSLWKRVKCFPSTLRRRSLKCNDRSCAWGKLWLGNHMIVLMSSFSKSFVFKIFSVHTKTKTRRFQISPVWRAFSKCSRPFSWQISVDCRLNRRIKDAFSNFSSTVCGA